MKLSDYIARLQQIYVEHGDIEVVVHPPGGDAMSYGGASSHEYGIGLSYRSAPFPDVIKSGVIYGRKFAFYGSDYGGYMDVTAPVVTVNRPGDMFLAPGGKSSRPA